MHAISRRKSVEFWTTHADAHDALAAWYTATRTANWRSLQDVRETYRSADAVGRWTVFNIRGNTYRVIVTIHYNRQKIYIRHVLTHAEYDRGDWKRE